MPSAVYASSAASPISGSVRTLSRCRWASTNGSVTSPPPAGRRGAGRHRQRPGRRQRGDPAAGAVDVDDAPSRSRAPVTTSGDGGRVSRRRDSRPGAAGGLSASVTPKPWTARRSSTGPGAAGRPPGRRWPPRDRRGRARSPAGPRSRASCSAPALAHTLRRDSRRNSRLALRLAGASTRSSGVRRPPASCSATSSSATRAARTASMRSWSRRRRSSRPGDRRTPPAGSCGPATAAGRS